MPALQMCFNYGSLNDWTATSSSARQDGKNDLSSAVDHVFLVFLHLFLSVRKAFVSYILHQRFISETVLAYGLLVQVFINQM